MSGLVGEIENSSRNVDMRVQAAERVGAHDEQYGLNHQLFGT